MLPNSNTRAGNRKEPSGVERHFALDLAGTKRAEWSRNALGGTLRPFSNCVKRHFEPLNMGHKQNSDKEDKRKTVMTAIELEKEIIAKYENGVQVSDLALKYGTAKSTISTFLKNKDIIKKADVAKRVTVISKQRPQIMEEMEKLIFIFIKEKELARGSISEAFICEKVFHIYDDLMKKSASTSGGESDDSFSFKASRGWFEKFKHTTGIHHVARHGEAASSDKTAAEKYVAEFNELVKAEEFVSQQVFSCDETGLFWKKMPANTYITREEKKMPGHKRMKISSHC